MSQIVLARTETVLVHDGRPYAADLGQRPKMSPKTIASAMMWLNSGTAEDVAKAQAWAEKESGSVEEGLSPWQVFEFDATEPDPIAKAKQLILRG